MHVPLDHLMIRGGHVSWLSFLRLPPPASGAGDARPKILPESSSILQNLLGEHDRAAAFLFVAPSPDRQPQGPAGVVKWPDVSPRNASQCLPTSVLYF